MKVNQMLSRCCAGLVLVLAALQLQAAPAIESWQSSNGAKVFFVEAPELPMVDVRVVFDAGSARDGDLPGIAMLTNGLLTEGAEGMNADLIAERIEGVGAQLGTDSLRDMAIVSLRSLTQEKPLAVALQTMSQVMSRPTFRQSAIDRNLQAMKVLLRQEKQSPSSIASKAFYRAMYDGHPYAHPSNGTDESLKLLNREAILDFYQRHYVARNATVAIVGALSRERAVQLAEQVVGNLPAGEPVSSIPSLAAVDELPRKEIQYPSTQAHLFLGMPVMSRKDPDYFPLYVGNHVLGGSGLVSMITREVREERGLAYSAYSYFSPMREPGPFVIGLQTKNAQAQQAEAVVRETLAGFLENGPSAEDLERSKQNITGGFPLRVASNRNIVQYLAMLGFYDLPLNYLDTFVDSINAVTAEQIRDAFQRRIDPDKLATVVVGRLETDTFTNVQASRQQ